MGLGDNAIDMGTSTDDALPTGKVLYEAGWRQGVVFTATSANFAHNLLPPGGSAFELRQRLVKAKERLVLISQDCDLVAKDSDEPFVEALICDTVKPSHAVRIDRNSAREFIIDPESHLAANAKYRISLDKSSLQPLSFSPWPSSRERFERFVIWLARRYDRPAIPDAMHEVFHRPLVEVFEALDVTSPQIAAAFSRAIREVRVNLPESETPPFDLQLVFLLRLESLTEEEANSLSAVMEAIHSKMDSHYVVLAPNPRVVTTEEISMAEYFATRPLFLEYLTYKGDEVHGAPPFPRA